MKTVLVTGFEPFGDESVNPSWGVVSSLDNAITGGYRATACQLSCASSESLAVLNAAIDVSSPSLVSAVKQAGGRTDITVERMAINVDDARIADNQGQQSVDMPIVVDGPATRFSILSTKATAVAMRSAGIPASVSQTAGTFVCDHVIYGLLHKLRGVPAVKGGFIHIPYLSQQAAQYPRASSMVTETVYRALEIAIATALQVESDIAVTGGVIH